jgi:hypothetical protein
MNHTYVEQEKLGTPFHPKTISETTCHVGPGWLHETRRVEAVHACCHSCVRVIQRVSSLLQGHGGVAAFPVPWTQRGVCSRTSVTLPSLLGAFPLGAAAAAIVGTLACRCPAIPHLLLLLPFWSIGTNEEARLDFYSLLCVSRVLRSTRKQCPGIVDGQNTILFLIRGLLVPMF